jgi:hypothetical protein
VLVGHTCNHSYSGGRDQEDQGSKPAQANNSERSYLKKTHHKKGLLEWLKVKDAGEMAQVAEHLPSKPEVLRSGSSTTKKKKRKDNLKNERKNL